MAKPTASERRAAIAVAKRVANENEPLILDSGEVVLMARTLLAAQEAFSARLAPVYAAALDLVRDDGSQDARAWFAFKDLVLACKAHDRSLPSSEGVQ